MGAGRQNKLERGCGWGDKWRLFLPLGAANASPAVALFTSGVPDASGDSVLQWRRGGGGGGGAGGGGGGGGGGRRWAAPMGFRATMQPP